MNTDKQPESCFIYCHGKDASHFLGTTIPSIPVKEIKNVYIFTTEELEALLQKERREAAEKAWDQSDKTSYEKMAYHCGKNGKYEHPNKEEYLNKHYPLPKPPKQ